MPQRFKQTENAIEKGLENTKPAAGAKLVESWVGELEGLDMPGAKGVHGDLERLHKELTKDEPDSAKIEKILGKLGPATLKLADRCDDEKVAEKVRSLGEALNESGTESDDDDD